MKSHLQGAWRENNVRWWGIITDRLVGEEALSVHLLTVTKLM